MTDIAYAACAAVGAWRSKGTGLVLPSSDPRTHESVRGLRHACMPSPRPCAVPAPVCRPRRVIVRDCWFRLSFSQHLAPIASMNASPSWARRRLARRSWVNDFSPSSSTRRSPIPEELTAYGVLFVAAGERYRITSRRRSDDQRPVLARDLASSSSPTLEVVLDARWLCLTQLAEPVKQRQSQSGRVRLRRADCGAAKRPWPTQAPAIARRRKCARIR